jgi:hypothetical protein
MAQSVQGADVVDSIATMASCAERRRTFVVVPSCNATSPSGGASSESGFTDATIPAMSACLLLPPTASTQSPIWPVSSPTGVTEACSPAAATAFAHAESTVCAR